MFVHPELTTKLAFYSSVPLSPSEYGNTSTNQTYESTNQTYESTSHQ